MDIEAIQRRLRIYKEITQSMVFLVEEDTSKREVTKIDDRTKANLVVREANPARFFVKCGHPVGFTISDLMPEDQAKALAEQLFADYSAGFIDHINSITRSEILKILG